jgi:hypothetical protein
MHFRASTKCFQSVHLAIHHSCPKITWADNYFTKSNISSIKSSKSAKKFINNLVSSEIRARLSRSLVSAFYVSAHDLHASEAKKYVLHSFNALIIKQHKTFSNQPSTICSRTNSVLLVCALLNYWQICLLFNENILIKKFLDLVDLKLNLRKTIRKRFLMSHVAWRRSVLGFSWEKFSVALNCWRSNSEDFFWIPTEFQEWPLVEFYSTNSCESSEVIFTKFLHCVKNQWGSKVLEESL